jgi:S-adenosylmethionine-diacylgycerolhomoserine-N-methlytransferase
VTGARTSMLADTRILLQLLRGMPAGTDAAHRLESFYAPQASSYDRFRRRLLHGRAELIASLALPANADVVEMGAGTGSNMELFGGRLAGFSSLRLVDLCPSLLRHAQQRARGLPNVQVIAADACEYRPPAAVDCVIFSYSLTMIPDWRGAILNAVNMLRPGGKLAIVDFTLPSTRRPLLREFWRRWFGHDGVMLDDSHVATLERMLPQHHLLICRAPVLYLPGLRVPYYRFIGIKSRPPADT